MTAAVPFRYKLLFAYIEPLSTFGGFIYAWFFQDKYHGAIIPGRPVTRIDDATRILVSHLSNLFLVLSLISGLLWRRTSDVQVLQDLTLAFLVGDLGHLYSIAAVQGVEFLVDYRQWNAMAMGNIGFTVVYMMGRVSLLLHLRGRSGEQAGKPE